MDVSGKEAPKQRVFIGYSLPAADFEFKYLLKRVQLACSPPPNILVVTGGTDENAKNRALKNYRGLFGTLIEDKRTFFRDGLTPSLIGLIT